MADDVKWVQMKVDMFDGNSFKRIKRATIGGVDFRDKLTAVWFELLALAGKSNANGFLHDGNGIPFQSDQYEDIAILIDRKAEEVELCIGFFLKEKMVEIIEDMWCLPNFVKYQSADKLEAIREYKRLSQAKWRAKIKEGGKELCSSTHTSTSHLPSISISSSNSDNYISIGMYGNVRLDIAEFEKIKEEFGERLVLKKLEDLSEWLKSTGRKYEDYAAALRSWCKKDAEAEARAEMRAINNGGGKKKPSFDEILRGIVDERISEDK